MKERETSNTKYLIGNRMYIYKTTNKINNKIYIGLSTKKSEKSENYYGSGKAIRKAIQKYGKDNFSKTIIIENDDFSYKDLQKLEIKYIKEFDSRNPNIGYNISFGGDCNYGIANGMYNQNHSDETKLKIAETKRQRRQENKDYGKRKGNSKKAFSKFISDRNSKNPTLPNGHSEKTKKAISKTVKKKISTGEIKRDSIPFSEEKKKLWSEMFSGDKNPFYGKKHSKETKEKIKKSIRDRLPGVAIIDTNNNKIKEYKNIQDVKMDGYRIDLVRLVCEGKNKTHKGKIWMYL